jgi:hypothetical protein
MTNDEAYGFELQAAVDALSPDAAPLAAALLRGNCIHVPPDAYAPLLAAVDRLCWADTVPSNLLAQAAMLAVWRGAQARVGGAQVGAPEAWQTLSDMGLLPHAHAAIIFDLSVTSATMRALAADEPATPLH